MNNSKRNRITMKLKSPNPLFKKWLTEWRKKARMEQSKMEFCFNKALQSLKRYPLPLESGKDCKILKGFGEKLCLMIDNKLKAHQGGTMTSSIHTVRGDLDCNVVNESVRKNRKTIQSDSSPKCTDRSSKEYLPHKGSGGYAILVTLYMESLGPMNSESLRKQEIIEKGQHLSHTSFVKPDPGSRYTAWSSMKTLITKNLVVRKSNPPKFSLTNEGLALAKKLLDEGKNLNLSAETPGPLFKSTMKGGYTQNEESNINWSEDTELSYYSTCNASEKSADGESCFSSRQIEHKNVTNVYTYILGDNALYFGNRPSNPVKGSTSLSSENAFHSDVINKNKSKIIERHVSSNSLASSSTSCAQEECFILPPNSFDIILYVDTCETTGSNALIQDDPILAELRQSGVAFEVTKLKIGDYIWICRDRISKKELVLPYVIERKRMDDFGHSIKDGRYYEQKFRLKRCGLQNIIYLIEKFGNNQHVGLPIATLHQAATNTAIQDGFCVKFSGGIRDTAKYLEKFTATLLKMFNAMTLVSCPKENLSDISLKDDLISLMTFEEFNHASSKNKPIQISDLFVKMLIQIKGMSVDRALAIVREYPTPALLKRAYERNPGERGENLLASIQFGEGNKNLGPVLSKIVHQLFTLESFN